jgi:hypothetical protein
MFGSLNLPALPSDTVMLHFIDNFADPGANLSRKTIGEQNSDICGLDIVQQRAKDYAYLHCSRLS